MKIFYYIGLSLLCMCNIYSIDEKILIQKIDEQNTEEIIQLFEDNKNINFLEAKELLQKVYQHYDQPFDKKILRYEEGEIIQFIKDTYLLAFSVFGVNVKDHLLRYYVYEVPEATIDVFQSNIMLNRHLPKWIVIGGTEILIGVLVWILPYPGTKYVGKILINDGIIRALRNFKD